MAQTHRLNEERYQEQRSLGIRLAKVVAHKDPNFMGRLTVTLITTDSDPIGLEGQTVDVYYCPPFFGSTNYVFNGSNTGNENAFNDTQKSYGMSFIPPDIGVTVLCVFESETGKGFWVGCVPDTYMNNMVPAIAASSAVDLSPTQKEDFGNIPLPVAEYNRAIQRKEGPDETKKPVHPIAGFMLEQGLIEDDIRGRTSSTMRRNQTPSVFGISTPGPLDKRPGAKRMPTGTSDDKTKPIPVSRVGGTQFVMDDGDDRFVRKTPAAEGPPEYANVLKGEKGDVRIPISEYFRVRTRTGHQILLHNSEDLIYIGNSRGTSWIELTSNGKIDIFAADSVSIHTQGDFNFRADRDINLEAGRNINVRAEKNYTQDIEKDFSSYIGGTVNNYVGGEIQNVFEGSLLQTVGESLELTVGSDQKIKVAGNSHLTAGTSIFSTAGTDSHFLSGSKHVQYAERIEIKCDPATPAQSPILAERIVKEERIKLHPNEVVDASQKYAQTRYQSFNLVQSIMKRMPMHEPWYKHENVNPQESALEKTDRETRQALPPAT
jgi:hypothetical protein